MDENKEFREINLYNLNIFDIICLFDLELMLHTESS